MSENISNLINAIEVGDAVATEQSFSAAMSEKISAKLDAMRVDLAQNMFKTATEVSPEPVETPAAE